MISNIPITKAKHELNFLPEKLTQQGGTLAITRSGKPCLSCDDMGALRSNPRNPRNLG